MALGSNLAGVARVAFEAQTSGFYTELRTVETRWNSTLARMEARAARFRGVTLSSAAGTVAGGTGAAGATAVSSRPAPSQSPAAQRAMARRRAMGVGPPSVAGAAASAGGFAGPNPAVVGAAAGQTERLTKAQQAGARATTAYGAAAASSDQKTRGMTSSVLRSTLAFAGIIGGIAIVRGLGRALAETERVNAQTNAVIESTGGIAGVTAREVSQLSLAMQKKSLFDDEVIQSGLNMLLTFKNIRNVVGENNDIFNQSSAVLVDMGAAFNRMTGGTDGLQRMSVQLGKALNDPIKGITALTRVGVTFDAQQKQQIRTLVESGRTLEAQKIILAELRTEFGGSAAAQAKTFTGSLIVLKNTMLEATENLTTQLAPALRIVVLALKGTLRVAGALKPVLVALTIAWAAFKIQVLFANSAVLMFIPRLIRLTVAMVLQHGVLGTLRIAWLALNAAIMANPIGAIVLVLALLAAALYMAWKKSETFRNIVQKVFEVVATAVAKWIGLIVKYMDLWLGALSQLADAASKLPLVGDFFKGVSGGINESREALRRLVEEVEDFAKKDFTGGGGDPQPGEEGYAPHVQTTGGGTTDRPDASGGTTSGGTKGLTDLPGGLTLREAQARRREDEAALRQVLRDEIDFLKRKLRTKKLNKQEKAELINAIAGIESELRSMDDQAAQERDQVAQDAEQAAQERERAAEAREQRAAEARAAMMTTPDRISAGRAAAVLTEKWLADDEKWAKLELTHLRNLRRRKDLTYAEKRDLDTRIAQVEADLFALDEARAQARRDRQAERAEREDLLIENARARAELTESDADDQRVLKREERLVRRRLAALKAKVKLSNDELAEQTRLLQRLGEIRRELKEGRDQEKTDATRAAQMFHEWMSGMTGMITQFGDTLLGPANSTSETSGQTATYMREQVALMREQNERLAALAAGVSHPNSRYAHSEIGAVFSGEAL